MRIASAVKGLSASFSGAESQAQRLIDGGGMPAEIAYGVYDCMARSIAKLLLHAGAQDVLLCGGVAGRALLTKLLSLRTDATLYRSAQGLSGDNAVGVALYGLDRLGVRA